MIARQWIQFATEAQKHIEYKRHFEKHPLRPCVQMVFATEKHMTFFAHPTAIIDEGCRIGTGTKIWHFSHITTGAEIGGQCTIGQNVFIAANVVLGNNVKVQNNVSIYEGVVCEDDVFLGPSMVFTNVINPRSAIIRKDQFKKTLVRKGASIGANATIICGIEIGEYAFIGAGSVVTKSVLSYAVVLGNPATQTGWISEYGHTLEFNKDNIAVCKESGDAFVLENNSVRKIVV